MENHANVRRPLLDGEISSVASGDLLSLKGFLGNGPGPGIDVGQGDRERSWKRGVSFACALLNCLCAGSILTFSLYGHLFQSDLRYTQLEVNSVSIATELSVYLPVPLMGFLCDRYNPGLISGLSSLLFGLGYLLAALAYRKGPPPSVGGDGWPLGVMILAFVGIGIGTCSMYISAVTTCAKNFGRGKHKGVALASPIAAFGLSSMWESQLGSQLLSDPLPNGQGKVLNVSKFFLFLSVLLFVVGIIGFFGLKVVDEEELIDEAVEELGRSGMLDDQGLFEDASTHSGYGTVNTSNGSDGIPVPSGSCLPTITRDKRRKNWLLRAETSKFLADPNMWLFAAGFFLVTGPGETFINNLGTIIGTLNLPPTEQSVPPTSVATHVSIVGVTSTVARILTGTLSDLFAPVPVHRPQSSSACSSPPPSSFMHPKTRFRISRITLIILSGLILALGQVILASGLVQDHAERFWWVSACVGVGYGAVFSLTPIICSVVWGVENFGTNWGIIAILPAFGATFWSLVYSAVYQAAAVATPASSPSSSSSSYSSSPFHLPRHDISDNTPFKSVARPLFCFGKACYQSTYWAMTISVWCACFMWFWAWRAPKTGWLCRGLVV